MLTYDYFCEVCCSEFELQQKITDEKITVCPACGNSETFVRQVASGSAPFILTGSGWTPKGG